MSHPTVVIADTVAERAHAGQFDKAGLPYITHPRRVAENADRLARILFPRFPVSDAIAVALLHDVLEDCPDWTETRLLEEGIPEHLIPTVKALTHHKGETRVDYITRIIEAGPLAVLVKAADLLDNSDPSRLNILPPEQKARLEAKYATDLLRIGTALADYSQHHHAQ